LNGIKIKIEPLVSVIMNCFNGDRYLSNAIDSVLSQTYQNWELIFWDNQSTDSSSKITLSYDDARIKYYYAPTHSLLYEARNQAIMKSCGEFLSFLDVDDWWEPGKLSAQIVEFENPEVGLVCSNFQIHNYNLGTTYPKWKQIKSSRTNLNHLLKEYHIGLLTMVIRRQAFEDLGGFKNNFHIIGDFDFSIRLATSWKIVTLQSIFANCRLHGENESLKKQSLNVQELKFWLQETKNHPILGKLSLTNIQQKIQYKESIVNLQKKDLKKLWQSLKPLFPTLFFFKIILMTLLSDSLIKYLKKRNKYLSKIY